MTIAMKLTREELVEENKQLKCSLRQAEAQVEFWTGSGESISKQDIEYRRLCKIPIDDRTGVEIDQLRKLARLLMTQVDWCPNCLGEEDE